MNVCLSVKMPYNCFVGLILPTFEFSAKTAENPGISSFSASNSNKFEARIASTRKLRSILYTDVSISTQNQHKLFPPFPNIVQNTIQQRFPLIFPTISCYCNIVHIIFNFYFSRNKALKCELSGEGLLTLHTYKFFPLSPSIV